MSSFALLLRTIRRRYPSVRALARALDVDPSQLSRAMGRNGQPFDVVRCLRLARVTGEHPSDVLRAAGKAEVAQLIEELYAGRVIDPEVREWVTAYTAIPPGQVRRSLLALAVAAAGLDLKVRGRARLAADG